MSAYESEVTSANESDRRSVSSLGDRDRKAFSELLSLAEKVQSEKDSLQRQMYFSIGAGLFTMLTIFSVLASFLDITNLDRLFSSPAGALSVSVLASAYVAFNYFFIQYSRRLRRERKAFEEVMNLVHEVFNGAKDEMSPLEVAEVKIRLSRLDI